MTGWDIQFVTAAAGDKRDVLTGRLGPLRLYWHTRIDAAGVWQSHSKRLFGIAVNIFLGLVIVHGVVRWLLTAWDQSWHIGLTLFMRDELFVFWVACLAATYLIFRWRRQEREQRVLTQHDLDELQKSAPAGTERPVDVAASMPGEVRQLVFRAWVLSKQQHLSAVTPLTLLLAVMEHRKMIGVLARLGISREDVIARVQTVLQSNQHKANSSPVVSEALLRTLLRSYALAVAERFSWIGVAQLLEAILQDDKQIQDIFYDMEISEEKMGQVVRWLAVNDQLYEGYRRYRRLARFKPKNSMNRSMTAVATPYLDRFGHDLTLAAKYGTLEICVGRHQEIEEVFRIIEAGSDSVVLVGYPGVGKTAIIDGIAQRMVTEDVPGILRDKRMFSLSLPRLLAGATSPGMLEERVLRIHHEILRAGNVVLVIENVHDIYGVNTQSGEGLDLSEVIADLIGDERFLVLTTSNPVDYRRSIAGKALGNKLQKVEVAETDKEQTFAILVAKVNYYEYKYKIFFSLDALNKAIDLSNRYLHDYFLPEKAIKILEEVAVYIQKRKGEKSLVTGEDVAALISEKVNIPLTKITQDESQKLLHLEDEIHEHIVNQAEAVQAVASALRRARTELRDEARPIVNLLFLGPTGVGKTELAKTIASTYFGSSDDMVRLDMSEYQEKSSIGRLIGTQESASDGLLTEGVRENPYTVLLLDEIEKAHPDILNVFLQVMDDGRLTDWSGRVVDFTNVIVVATSNAGTQFIQDSLQQSRSVAAIKEQLITEKLKGVFRPEFLNRFDNIVVFTPLTPEHIKQVARLMLKKSQSRLLQKGIHLEVSEAALAELAAAGFDPLFGARPMRRVIQERVEDALARFLLSGKVSRRDVAVLMPGGRIEVQKAKQYL